MADHQQESDELPAMIEAGQVPRNFLRQIARPDDQELGKRKIRPHHDHGEQELAEIVQMARSQHFRHGPLVGQLIVVNGNPLENLKVLYPSGIEEIRDGKQVHTGGVEWTIKDGIPYHVPELMARVKEMVAQARKR